MVRHAQLILLWYLGFLLQWCVCFLNYCPDMTFVVDWALKTNYLSVSKTIQFKIKSGLLVEHLFLYLSQIKTHEVKMNAI